MIKIFVFFVVVFLKYGVTLSPCEWICVVGSTSPCFVFKHDIMQIVVHKASLLGWNVNTETVNTQDSFAAVCVKQIL